ncbi:MAG: CDP-alcohol phosphatidyltransferase family protein [Pedosphaera sp.]|nr:CDP-alcohol phosphatidyltransferase family protein [Pedosphaera sp.]
MTTPAVLFFDPANSPRALAVLTLLDRQVIAAHRAGCAPITIVREAPLPSLRRSAKLGIEVTHATASPALHCPTLLIQGNVLVHAADLRRLIAECGRLATPSRQPLPVGVATSWAGSVSASLAAQPSLIAAGVAHVIEDDLSFAQAEEALWDSMGSSSDGVVDRYFNRPVGRLFSKVLIHTPVTPNQVSVFATLLGVAAAWLCLAGTHERLLLGAVLLQFSAVIDCVDGDIARVLHKETPAGKWIDIVGDQVVHLCLFLALGFGLATRPELATTAKALGLVAAVGAVVSFAVVLRGMLRGGASGRLQALVDKTTNRDFSVVLLALAIVDRVEWFLWMAAIGTHCFWLLALWVQRSDEAAAAPPVSPA